MLGVALTRVLIAAFILGVGACGGRFGSQDSKPIPECEQYERVYNSCFHRNTSIADQPSFVARSAAERERITTICTDNLRRIRVACR